MFSITRQTLSSGSIGQKLLYHCSASLRRLHTAGKQDIGKLCVISTGSTGASHFKSLANNKCGLSSCAVPTETPPLKLPVFSKNSSKPRIVLLGTGWVGFNFIRSLDKTMYDLVVVSPYNYFAFTPFLPAVCVGTLSEHACVQPVRNFLPTDGASSSTFFESYCTDVDFENKTVLCEVSNGSKFHVEYDYLVIGIGTTVNTFGIQGVEQYAYFLKNVRQANGIRRKVLNNFELAALPTADISQIRSLLHFIVVGGGPTGVEVAAELADLMKEDMSRTYPTLAPYARITLIEMTSRLLPMFSESVSDYTKESFINHLEIRTLLQHAVVGIDEQFVQVKNLLEDKDVQPVKLEYGFILWASGVGQLPLAHQIISKIDAQKGNRVMKVNAKFKLKGAEDVYALGDCSYMEVEPLKDAAETIFKKYGKDVLPAEWLYEHLPKLKVEFPQLSELKWDIRKNPPAERMRLEDFRLYADEIDKAYTAPSPTGQNARQAAQYLAAVFNNSLTSEAKAAAPNFVETWAGALAYIGGKQAVANTPHFTILGGKLSFSFWKVAYLRMQASWTTIFTCIFDWSRTAFKGRPTTTY